MKSDEAEDRPPRVVREHRPRDLAEADALPLRGP